VIRTSIKDNPVRFEPVVVMDRSGIEPEASPMPRERSTPDLPAHQDDSHSTRFQIKVSITFLVKLLY
jgi:hypothetical protein